MELTAANIYADLTLLSFVVNLTLAVVILTVDRKNRLNQVYAMAGFGIAWWALFALGAAFSTTADNASIHFKLSAPGWCFLPAFYLHFGSIFVGKNKRPFRSFLIRAYYVIAALLTAGLWVGGLMHRGMRRVAWGFTDVPGPVYQWVFEPFLIGGFVLVIVDIIMHARKVEDHDEKVRSILVLAGLSIPLLGGTLTNMILPSLGVFVIELAVPLTTLNVAVVSFAMVRYRFLTLTFEYAASVIINTMGDTLLVLGPRGQIRLVNPAALEMLGYTADELAGMPIGEVFREPTFDHKFADRVERTGTLELEVDYLTKQGDAVSVSLSVSTLQDRKGKTVGYVLVAKDIRETKKLIADLEEAQKDLEELAITDDLTGLYNRRYLTLKIQEELLRSRRYERPFSVVMIDLDHFKDINDRFGHEEGDLVLHTVANAIRPVVRTIDTVARYGGDEFLVLLPETDTKQAVEMAARIREHLSGDLLPEDYRFVTASLGVATYDPAHPEKDHETLFRLADWALLQAKRTGRNRVVHARDTDLDSMSPRDSRTLQVVDTGKIKVGANPPEKKGGTNAPEKKGGANPPEKKGGGDPPAQ